MTVKARKRDLRTRVAVATFDQVRRYAAAHGITQYAAAERLVLHGLDATNTTAEADAAVRAALEQLAAKAELLAALIDRSLFGAMVGYREKAGIEKILTPHLLRHACGTQGGTADITPASRIARPNSGAGFPRISALLDAWQSEPEHPAYIPPLAV